MVEMFAHIKKRGVTGATVATPATCCTPNPLMLHRLPLLPLLSHENDGLGATDGAIAPPEPDEAAVRDLYEERDAMAVVDGSVPTEYADAWAAFQIRKPSQIAAGVWYRLQDDAGRFLDSWADLALSFGWQPTDIFGADGVAWFCARERIRALGPDNAVAASGRVFTREGSERA